MLDAGFVDAFDEFPADEDARDGGVAEAADHVGLDRGGGRVEGAVLDMIAGEDGPDLFAVRAPRGVVENDALAAPGRSRARAGEAEQHSGCQNDEAQAANGGSTSRHHVFTRGGSKPVIVTQKQMLH